MDENEDLIRTVIKRAEETGGRKRLACAEAFKLSRKLNVEPADIGLICNQHDIRICKCQLGCFP